MTLIPELLTAEPEDSSYKYEHFKRTYFDAPDRFAHECIIWPDGQSPTAYQSEILANLPHRRRVSARGPHGLGKSALAAIAVHWFALTRDGHDWKVVTTASVWRQLSEFLWPEVRKWARYINWDLVGRQPYSATKELFTLKLTLDTGSAFAVASDDPQQIEGAHADHILYIFDESKIIPDPTWDSVEGAMSTGHAYWLAISTPGEPVGRFYDIQTRQPGYEDWWVRHVTLREAVDAGRIDPAWAEQRKRQWGARSTMYLNRVEGEFASSAEESVIPAAWVDAAIERGRQLGVPVPQYTLPRLNDATHAPSLARMLPPRAITHIGIDPARKGGDPTVYFPRMGNICLPPIDVGSQETMESVGQIVHLFQDCQNAIFIVDVIGVGAGIYDRTIEVLNSEHGLREPPVYAFISSGRTNWIDISENLKFVDVRSAAWWNMRELLDPAYDDQRGMQLILPDNKDLRAELVAPSYKALSDGRIKIESKDDIRDRLGRSTNYADALIMSFWEESFMIGMEYA